MRQTGPDLQALLLLGFPVILRVCGDKGGSVSTIIRTVNGDPVTVFNLNRLPVMMVVMVMMVVVMMFFRRMMSAQSGGCRNKEQTDGEHVGKMPVIKGSAGQFKEAISEDRDK